VVQCPSLLDFLSGCLVCVLWVCRSSKFPARDIEETAPYQLSSDSCCYYSLLQPATATVLAVLIGPRLSVRRLFICCCCASLAQAQHQQEVAGEGQTPKRDWWLKWALGEGQLAGLPPRPLVKSRLLGCLCSLCASLSRLSTLDKSHTLDDGRHELGDGFAQLYLLGNNE
jgi:hypothetical protein